MRRKGDIDRRTFNDPGARAAVPAVRRGRRARVGTRARARRVVSQWVTRGLVPAGSKAELMKELAAEFHLAEATRLGFQKAKRERSAERSRRVREERLERDADFWNPYGRG